MPGVPGFSLVAGLLARLRSLWRGLRRRGDVEAEMREEFRHHLDLRAEELARQGLTPREARRRARIEFGHVESHREAARAARGLRPFDQIRFSWLDVKLGIRMLARYPGLTVVAGLTMAFAIGVGAGLFEVIKQVVDPTLPLPDGDRIVALWHHDRAENEQRPPYTYDLVSWRDGLATLEDVGGYRSQERNLRVNGATAGAVAIAEISAAAFRATRTPALLGRTLVESDDAARAPAVVLLGHRVWHTQFGGDSGVVGREVLIGEERATVVGVMPEGFRFPYNYDVWVPLRLSDVPLGPGEGPPLRAFGRLALQGVSGDDLLLRASVYSLNLVAVLFLILICANVALLMFARAATREREILVRGALGASRARIVTQLFAEALVLGTVAAALGLAAAGPAVHAALAAIYGGADRWPFWTHASLSPTTAVYAASLAVLASVIAGVIPALKVTDPRLETRLRAASAGGGGIRMGGIWRGVIMAQIAATMVFVAVTYPVQRYADKLVGTAVGFEAAEYLAVRIEMDPDDPMEAATDSGQERFLERYAARVEELRRRVAAEPAVVGVTVAGQLPLMEHRLRLVEVDGEAAPRPREEWAGHPVVSASVDRDFFDVFQAPVLAGRVFDSRDLEEGARTIVVNESFVDQVLGGRNAIGRRVRELRPEGEEPGPWYEIVGVVPNLVLDDSTALDLDELYRAQLYRPLGRGRERPYPLHLAVHARSDLASLTPLLFRLAGDVSPMLRIDEIQPLDRVGSRDAAFWTFWGKFLLVVMAISLFLALSGIYSVMSFTVSRQTREIGIRVALGATAARVAVQTFRSPIRLVATGIAIGCVPVAALVVALAGTVTPRGVALFFAFAMTMMAVCALACIVPTRRALRVQPTEALGEEV